MASRSKPDSSWPTTRRWLRVGRRWSFWSPPWRRRPGSVGRGRRGPQIRDGGEFLWDDCHLCLLCSSNAPVNDRSVHQDHSLAGGVLSRHNLHKGGLAGAVLACERGHGARGQRQVDGPEYRDAVERLGDAANLQQGRLIDGCVIHRALPFSHGSGRRSCQSFGRTTCFMLEGVALTSRAASTSSSVKTSETSESKSTCPDVTRWIAVGHVLW